MGRRVRFHQWRHFLFSDQRTGHRPTLRHFWGAPQDAQEVPLR